MSYPPPGTTAADFMPTHPLSTELNRIWLESGKAYLPAIDSIGSISQWQGPSLITADGERFWVKSNGDIVDDSGTLARAWPYVVVSGEPSVDGDGPGGFGDTVTGFIRDNPIAAAVLLLLAYKAYQGSR